MSRPRKDLNVPTIFRMKDVKLRQFAELLCKTIAANHALYLGEREAANKIERAMFKVFEEEKVRTRDIGGTAKTAEFAEAIVTQMNN